MIAVVGLCSLVDIKQAVVVLANQMVVAVVEIACEYPPLLQHT